MARPQASGKKVTQHAGDKVPVREQSQIVDMDNVTKTFTRSGTSNNSLRELPEDVQGQLNVVRREDSVRSDKGVLKDHYDLGELLGRGAMGVVKQATCRTSGRKVAVKSVTPPTEKRKSDLLAELDIARFVHHPNIIRLENVVREGDKMHFVMELCTGGTLTDFINRSHLLYASSKIYHMTTEHFALYSYQMLLGIVYLHHHRIMHRDIKPQNYVLASHADRAPLKLTDFGLATRFEPNVPLTRSCGTLFTTAPEVLKCSYTEMCDVWSVGVSCFNLGVGYHPFHGASTEELEQNIMAGKMQMDPKHWELHPGEAWRLVEDLLTVDPALRPSAADTLALHPWLRKTAGDGDVACCAIL